MEAPPLSTPPPTTPTTPTPAAHTDSSPRFQTNHSWDADPPPPAKLRLMCSYGGHIVPRPHDKTLCYVGGDTRIIVIDRHTSLSDLHRRLSRNLLDNQPFSLKYQLPTEDLDSLITITSDEDLENMVEEYDRLNNAGGGGTKQGRPRLFLFPRSSSSIEQLLVETASTKSEDWFFNALNGKASGFSVTASERGFSESSSVNCLLGLDDEIAGKAAAVTKDSETQIEGSTNSGVNRNVNGNCVINQDIQSVPDSPMLDTTSSFDSSSSSPSLANLPPIRVHVDENSKVGLGASGIEEQFQQMSVAVAGNVNPPLPQMQEEVGGFIAAGATFGTAVSVLPVVVGGEYANRVVSDDERSDHSGHRKAQQVQLQPQQIPPQFIEKQANAFDLPSPDSVSSDGSIANSLSRQRQAVYHEQLLQIQSGNNRISSNQADLKTLDQNNNKIRIQPQFQESSYQYDQNQPQLHQPQQFVHPNSHYIPSSAMPMASYYSVYPSQQQQHYPHQSVLGQHYPIYFMAPNAPSSHSQTPPPAYNQTSTPPSSKPEIASGVYRTSAPQLVQVPSTQHQPQYVAYRQIHHPSSAPKSNYTCEFADPSHAQVYYTPLPPQLAAQYQVAPLDATTENIKQQSRN